jgi:3-oxoadipate enol-lactonase
VRRAAPKVNDIDFDGSITHCCMVTLLRDREADGFAWRECGAGEPMLLLHGLGGSRTSWESQMNGLSHDCRLAAWDLPGYGASGPLDGPMTFHTLADAVIEWSEAMGVDRFHLVGISLGGMIAQYVAAAYPARVASLTLLATSPRFGLDGTQPDEWRAARLAPLDAGREPKHFAQEVLRSLADPSIPVRALASQVSAMSRISGAALRPVIDCLVTHDSQHLLGSIAAPTNVMVGERDQETPVAYSQALVDAIAGAQLHVIDGVGHLLNAEAPYEVNEVLRSLLGAALT